MKNLKKNLKESLLESLLDNDKELFDRTDIKNILLQTFPEKIKKGNAISEIEWNFDSDLFKSITTLDVDTLNISWLSKVSDSRFGYGVTFDLYNEDKPNEYFYRIIIKPDKNSLSHIEGLGYSIMSIIKDMLIKNNLNKLTNISNYCNKPEFKITEPIMTEKEFFKLLK